MQKYEKGSNRIGAGRLFQIAGYLGVPPGYFFEGLSAGARMAVGRMPRRAGTAEPEEVRQLTSAFGAIGEASTRASVLALVDRSRTRTGRERTGGSSTDINPEHLAVRLTCVGLSFV